MCSAWCVRVTGVVGVRCRFVGIRSLMLILGPYTYISAVASTKRNLLTVISVNLSMLGQVWYGFRVVRQARDSQRRAVRTHVRAETKIDNGQICKWSYGHKGVEPSEESKYVMVKSWEPRRKPYDDGGSRSLMISGGRGNKDPETSPPKVASIPANIPPLTFPLSTGGAIAR